LMLRGAKVLFEPDDGVDEPGRMVGGRLVGARLVELPDTVAFPDAMGVPDEIGGLLPPDVAAGEVEAGGDEPDGFAPLAVVAGGVLVLGGAGGGDAAKTEETMENRIKKVWKVFMTVKRTE